MLFVCRALCILMSFYKSFFYFMSVSGCLILNSLYWVIASTTSHTFHFGINWHSMIRCNVILIATSAATQSHIQFWNVKNVTILVKKLPSVFYLSYFKNKTLLIHAIGLPDIPRTTSNEYIFLYALLSFYLPFYLFPSDK